MPELPEVNTVASDLNTYVKDYTINKIIVMGSYKVFPDPPTFQKSLKTKTITGAQRIAKNIVINLDSGEYLGIHLAMTGQVLLREPSHKGDNFVRVQMEIAKDGINKLLRFCDMRMFGKISVLTHEALQALKNKYGPEPIDPQKTYEDFHTSIKSKRTNIKNALLDQEIVSGLGNIYATDTLFMSKIHPETPTQDLTLDQAKAIWENAKTILLEGIKHRGSTLDDKMYVDIFGKGGTHQNFFRIYGKETCPECKTKTQFIKLNGRGTYFCVVCQKKNQAPTLFG